MKPWKTTAIDLLDRVLPRRLKDAMFHVSYHLAQQEFERFCYRYGMAPNMRLGLEDVARRGLRPRRILDIGAYHGDWSRMAREIWPGAEIEMFEANLEKRAILTQAAQELGRVQVHFELLGPESGGEVEFFVMESGSSVYEENSPLERRTERRTIRALDDVLDGRSVDLIKIDTQGFELEVLKGGSQALSQAQGVILEISLLQINKSAPLLDEVIAFMKERGFLSYELLEVHRRPLDGAMNQIDILFVPAGSPLLKNTAHF